MGTMASHVYSLYLTVHCKNCNNITWLKILCNEPGTLQAHGVLVIITIILLVQFKVSECLKWVTEHVSTQLDSTCHCWIARKHSWHLWLMESWLMTTLERTLTRTSPETVKCLIPTLPQTLQSEVHQLGLNSSLTKYKVKYDHEHYCQCFTKFSATVSLKGSF